AAGIVVALLRPDPLLLARDEGFVDQGTSRGSVAAIREVAASPGARLGLVTIVAGQVAMISVMAMTPVYVLQLGHSHDTTLRVLGLTIGLHVVGMFAFSPVVGWLADRLPMGRHAVLGGGVALLLTACAIAGTAGHSAGRLAAGLGLLGLGWSACIIAGSTL